MELNNNYRIVYDTNNVILQYHEKRVREKKDGSKEEYEFTDDYFYPTLKQAMKSFVNKSLKGANSIYELVKRIEKLESK